MSSRVNWKKFLSAVLIGSVITTAIVVISIIIFGQLGWFEVRIITSALAFIGVSVLAFVSISQIQGHPWPTWAAIGFTALALVLSLVAIWISPKASEFWRFLASAWTMGIAFAYVCGLYSREISGWALVVRRVANGVILMLALIAILYFFAPSFVREVTHHTHLKIMGVLGVIAAANALIILISSWLGDNKTPSQ